MSHRWETPHHPDPTNKQATLLALHLLQRASHSALDRVGIWIDFCCLPQKSADPEDPSPHRSKEDHEIFSFMLRQLNLLQSECNTDVICGLMDDLREVPQRRLILPAAANDTLSQQYSTRAWCFMEACNAIVWSRHTDFASRYAPVKAQCQARPAAASSARRGAQHGARPCQRPGGGPSRRQPVHDQLLALVRRLLAVPKVRRS